MHPDVILPKSSVSITATDSNGEPCRIELEFPMEQLTLFISYSPRDGKIQISNQNSQDRVFAVGYGKKGRLKIKREKGIDAKHQSKPDQNPVLSRRTPKRLFLGDDD